MLPIVNTLSAYVKIRLNKHKIDNVAFQMHYRFTMWFIIVLIVLNTSNQLFGEHIKCIAGNGVDNRVINTFCYFTSTFTVVKYMNKSMLNQHDIAHPGVGSTGINSDEPIQVHAYYQWVPYVLSLQALTFYIPHLIWKLKEGGRLKNLVAGLEFAAYATDRNLNIGKFKTPTKTEIKQKFRDLNLAFRKRLIINKDWSQWLIICEFLNLFNIILQVILTNWFLDGAFLSLGPKLIQEHFNINSEAYILDSIFPKMTKCTFHKYGASGTIQSHDAMCVMAQNIINEKIYSFLWFWFLIIFIVSVCALIWRAVTALFGKSRQFNALIYSMEYSNEVNPWEIIKAGKRSDYLDWLFLTYVSKNMNPLVFKTFISELAKELEKMELIQNLLDEETPLFINLNLDDDSFGITK